MVGLMFPCKRPMGLFSKLILILQRLKINGAIVGLISKVTEKSVGGGVSQQQTKFCPIQATPKRQPLPNQPRRWVQTPTTGYSVIWGLFPSIPVLEIWLPLLQVTFLVLPLEMVCNAAQENNDSNETIWCDFICFRRPDLFFSSGWYVQSSVARRTLSSQRFHSGNLSRWLYPVLSWQARLSDRAPFRISSAWDLRLPWWKIPARRSVFWCSHHSSRCNTPVFIGSPRHAQFMKTIPHHIPAVFHDFVRILTHRPVGTITFAVTAGSHFLTKRVQRQ